VKTLEEQIRVYGDQARQLLEPVDIEQVTIETAPADEKRRTHPFAVFVAAAALVVVFLGLGSFLFRGDDQSPVAASPPETTVDSNTELREALRPQATVGPGGELEFKGWIYRTVRDGEENAGDSQVYRRMPESDEWERVESAMVSVQMNPMAGEDDYRNLVGLTTDGETLVAVAPWFAPITTTPLEGLARYGSCPEDFAVSISASLNGEDWTSTRLTDLPAGVEGTCYGMTRPTVAMGQQGMILTATVITAPNTSDENEFLLVWHSHDGVEWTAATLPDQMSQSRNPIDNPGRAWFALVTPRAGERGFEIGIWHDDDEAVPNSEIWESTDGLTWTSVETPGESQVSFHDYEFRAEGRQLLRRGPDSDWQSVEEVDSDYSLSLTTDGERLVAVSPDPNGLGGSKSADVRLQVFASEDGVTWEASEIADFGPVPCALRGCFVWPGGGEAVGPDGVLIVRVVTRPSFDDTYPHFWYSADGTAPWVRVDIDSALSINRPQKIGDREIDHVGPPVAQGNGFAIQITTRSGDREGVSDYRLETEVWESLDGLTWHKSP
jgi:hypothetical protein